MEELTQSIANMEVKIHNVSSNSSICFYPMQSVNGDFRVDGKTVFAYIYWFILESTLEF